MASDREISELKARIDELKRALRPFADLASVCDHFRKEDAVSICSWRISGETHRGPTAGDCRKAKSALDFAESSTFQTA